VSELTTLVDTSVLVAERPRSLEAAEGGWAVSAVTIGELQAGVLMATDPALRAARLRRATAVAEEAPALVVDGAVAGRYAELRAATGRRATNDLWIAATALAYGLTLLTRDDRQAALPLVRSVLVG
jgi:predicted nucleic acid-binding protein